MIFEDKSSPADLFRGGTRADPLENTFFFFFLFDKERDQLTDICSKNDDPVT